MNPKTGQWLKGDLDTLVSLLDYEGIFNTGKDCQT